MAIVTKITHCIIMLFFGIINLCVFADSQSSQGIQQPTPNHHVQAALTKSKQIPDKLHVPNIIHAKTWTLPPKPEKLGHDPKLFDHPTPKDMLPGHMAFSPWR